MKKSAFKTLLFTLPYVLTAAANTFFIVVDQSISNSIGETALIVFSTFVTLNWAIDTLKYGLTNGHSIVLARDKKNRRDINTTGIALQLFVNLTVAVLLFIFAEQITYIYTLSDEARTILTIILRLKAVQLSILSVGSIAENDLNIRKKVKTVFIIMATASIVNILGDLISVTTGANETGIYVATVVSTTVQTILLFMAAKFKLGRFRAGYAKEIAKHAKDLIINKLVQRVVNLTYTSIASSLGTATYAIYCACVSVSRILEGVTDGYSMGLLVNYSRHIIERKKGLLKKVDRVAVLGSIVFAAIMVLVTFPMWWLLGRVVPWEDCQPYIWFFGIDFVVGMFYASHVSYLSANKFTKPIRYMAFVGGICIRLPLAFLSKELGFGIYGLATSIVIDRVIRSIYIRWAIQRNRAKLYT